MSAEFEDTVIRPVRLVIDADLILVAADRLQVDSEIRQNGRQVTAVSLVMMKMQSRK
jgi:hypothetical protein